MPQRGKGFAVFARKAVGYADWGSEKVVNTAFFVFRCQSIQRLPRMRYSLFSEMLVKQRLHRMRELSPKATEGAKKCPLYLILPLDEIIQYKYIITIHYYLIPNKSSLV